MFVVKVKKGEGNPNTVAGLDFGRWEESERRGAGRTGPPGGPGPPCTVRGEVSSGCWPWQLGSCVCVFVCVIINGPLRFCFLSAAVLRFPSACTWMQHVHTCSYTLTIMRHVDVIIPSSDFLLIFFFFYTSFFLRQTDLFDILAS